jgi:hypothetical protein
MKEWQIEYVDGGRRYICENQPQAEEGLNTDKLLTR